MRKIHLTKYEQQIESTAEEFVPSDRATFNQIAQALAARKKDVVISIRLNKIDLAQIRNKARQYGIKYQSYISEIIHQAAVS